MRHITEEQLNALLEYLGTRPYREVAGAISSLVQLPKIEEEKKEKK